MAPLKCIGQDRGVITEEKIKTAKNVERSKIWDRDLRKRIGSKLHLTKYQITETVNNFLEDIPPKRFSEQIQLTSSKNHGKRNKKLSLLHIESMDILKNSIILILSQSIHSDHLKKSILLDYVQTNLKFLLESIIFKKTNKDECKKLTFLPFDYPPNATEIKIKNPSIKQKCAKKVLPKKRKSTKTPKSLEDIIQSYNNDSLPKIPPLGNHYSIKWVEEELKMQTNHSSCSSEQSRLPLAKRISPVIVEMMHKITLIEHNEKDPTIINQKLLKLLQEFAKYDEVSEKQLLETSDVCKQFYASQNVEEQLRILGLMQFLEEPASNSSQEGCDEVLEELIVSNIQLAHLRKSNKNSLTKFLKRSKKNQQQFEKKKVDELNTKILNMDIHKDKSWTQEEEITQPEKLSDLLDDHSSYKMPFDKFDSNDSEFNEKTQNLVELIQLSKMFKPNKQLVDKCDSKTKNKINIKEDIFNKKTKNDDIKVKFNQISNSEKDKKYKPSHSSSMKPLIESYDNKSKEKLIENKLLSKVKLKNSVVNDHVANNVELKMDDDVERTKNDFAFSKLNKTSKYFEKYDGKTSNDEDNSQI